MGRLYLETSAIRKLTDYKCSNDVFTSVFVLFELISGITNEDEFFKRRACIKRIIDQNIVIEKRMVDQILFELVGEQNYRKNTYDSIYAIAEDITKLNSFEECRNLKISFTHETPIYYTEQVSVLSWLQNWDENISNLHKNSGNMFHEDKGFILGLFNQGGLKAIAQYYWNLYEGSKFDERRIGALSAFISDNIASKFEKDINYTFSQYNFRLFITAQALIFAKSKYLNGGYQDKNNPSDLLHLLYLDRGDKMVSCDNIFCYISEGINDFDFINLNEKTERSLSELIKA